MSRVVWYNMRQRCYNPNNPGYKNYGGRGIKVCKRWHVYENFLADMGAPPFGLTLDRKDNNKGYCKSNCRWATQAQQAVHRRVTKVLHGRTITEWADLLKINRSTLVSRIRKHGSQILLQYAGKRKI